MEHTGDQKLLERYSSEKSQAAFAALVERHIGLVYSTCYRELGQKELAEDATQAVFIALAGKAKSIKSPAALVPWLYTAARHKAGDIRKQEGRRMAREDRAAEEAFRMSDWREDSTWSAIEPALNDAISALSHSDRQAILMRYFDEMSLREVGQALGTNEDAARMRVNRALEKLRSALTERKAAAISTVALAALLAERARYAVPAHLPSSIAQSADAIASFRSPSLARRGLRGGSGRGGSALNPLIGKGLILVSTTKVVAGGSAAVVLLLGIAIYAVHRAHTLRQGVVWQGAPVRAVAQPSQMVWNAPAATDPAARQSQQQIQAQLVQIAGGLSTGDARKIMSVFSPAFQVAATPRGRLGVNSRPLHSISYADMERGLSSWGPASVSMTVLSCNVSGNTAVVAFGNHHLIAHKPGGGLVWPGLIFQRIDGHWLVTTLK